MDKDVENIIGKGVSVYLIQEDTRDRGLSEGDLVTGVKKIARADIPALLDQHHQIWPW